MEKAKDEAFNHARLEVIKDGYDRGLECINTALTADEAGDKHRALELYRKGRKHLLRAISVPSRGGECVGASWESAREMQRKTQETLDNITSRLAALETAAQLPVVDGRVMGPPGDTPASVSDRPPVYTPQPADGHLSLSYGTESGERSLVGDDFYSRTPSPPGEDAEELLCIPQGVQIFFVTPDGQVSAPSYPGYLRLVKFSEMVAGRPPAFLQVCDWLYPLMCANSPVLLCNNGVFMFPDVMAPAPGHFVGVVLSSELPAADRELFQDLLAQMTELRVQDADEASEHVNLGNKVSIVTPAREPGEDEARATAEDDKNLPEWSEKVASGILTGASWLSWGLVKGAELTGKAIHKGASKLREHMTPEDKPAHVSPTVTKGLHVAKQATGGAVKVSQFLVDGVCTVAGCVGRELAPHVKKHGGKLVPESMRKDKDGRSNIDGAMVVAASGVQGFATMWTGFEVAAKNITTSVASETVTTVKHKYGAAAGQATDNAVNSAINVGVAAFNIDNLGVKAVVKRTGKQTAKAILEDYKLQDRGDSTQKQVEKSTK
ncbi:spartin-like isoform X1 [Stigmatopora nigra]